MSASTKRPRNQRLATPVRRKSRSGVLSRVQSVLWQFSLVAIAATCVVGCYLYGGEIIKAGLQRPVESVQVEGQFVYLNRQQATTLIAEAIDNEYVSLDIARLKREIELHPWVERAIVARGLSSTLRVTLIEQAPIARWGSEGFLNQRGEIVRTAATESLQHLPELYGSSLESEKIMRQFQDLSLMLRSRKLTIAKLWVDELGGWTLDLQSGVRLVLGGDELVEKVKRFLVVYDEYLVQRFEAVKQIDLRYANGLAVAWSDDYVVTIESTS